MTAAERAFPVAGRVFLDTNILIDCVDENDADRLLLCRSHLRVLRHADRAVISTQVLQEFFAVATRTLGLQPDPVRTLISDVSLLPTVVVTPDLIDRAIGCHQSHRISFWDALIVVCAASAECQFLLSADLNSGQIIEGVEIVDPHNWPLR